MGLTCLTCGNSGFTNAFVHCAGCLDFVVHRYCLGVIPKTFDEYVHWLCDECGLKVLHKRHKLNFRAIGNGNEQLSNELASQENEKEKTKDNQSKHPNVSDEEPHAKEKKRYMVEPAMEDEQNSKKLRKESTSKDTMRLPNSVNDSVLPKEKEEKKSGEKSLSEQLKEDDVTASSEFDNQGYERSCEARNENDSAKDQSITPYFDPEEPNEPDINPIWRGCFELLGPKQRRLEGFVAHIACKACEKVYDVARQFQPVLQLEMVPKLDIWPKSFHKLNHPNVDNIALYFFPSKTSLIEYDQLVQKMVDDDVALRAHAQNAELLLFPSTELQIRDWRLQEKYYVWGVFKGKQPVLSQTKPNNKDLEYENAKNENTLKEV